MIIMINGAYREENESYARRLIEQGIAIAVPEATAAEPAEEPAAEAVTEPEEEPAAEPTEEPEKEPAEEPTEEPEVAPQTTTRKSRKK